MQQKMIIPTTVILLIFVLLFIPIGTKLTKADSGCYPLPIPHMPFIHIPCTPPKNEKCLVPLSGMDVAEVRC
jgi:hypothetical protein